MLIDRIMLLAYGKFVIDKSINRIKSLENVLTKFSPLSDVGILNNNPFLFNKMSIDTLNVLKIGDFISKNTFGYFDMGMGNLLCKFGIDNFVPIVGNITEFSDMNDDLFIFDGDYLKLNRKNSMVDLGGIGKGFTIDECLKESIQNWLLNDAQWNLVEASFYTQYEFSLKDTELPHFLKFIISTEYLSDLKARMEKIYAVDLLDTMLLKYNGETYTILSIQEAVQYGRRVAFEIMAQIKR